MRSSMFVLRVLTMLAFVVLLPAVAIMGLSLPASVRQFLEPEAVSRETPAVAKDSLAAKHEGTPKPFEDDRYGDRRPRPTHEDNAARPSDERRPVDATQNAARRPQAMANPSSLPPSDGAGVPNVAEIPPAPWRNPPSELPHDPGTQPLRTDENPPNYPTTGFDPSVRTASAEESSRPIEGAADPRRAAAPPNEFQEIQQRLQDLGATYYRLETWAGRSQFRFHCRMAVRDNSHYSRNFEATDADAMAAMRRVLEQVERWRSGAPARP